MNNSQSISIPALVAHGFPLRPVRAGETAAGWAMFSAGSEDDARSFMAANPQAAMPCWKREDFFTVMTRTPMSSSSRSPL